MVTSVVELKIATKERTRQMFFWWEASGVWSRGWLIVAMVVAGFPLAMLSLPVIFLVYLFGSMVAIAFQIIFHAKIHANDIFFNFFFDISTSKWFENTKNILI